MNWVAACDAAEHRRGGRDPFEHGGETYAIYHTPSGYYATDGICTHEHAELADGLVMGDIIECPMHNGRFHIPTGAPKSPPVCVNLQTYPVRLEGGKVLIGLPGCRVGKAAKRRAHADRRPEQRGHGLCGPLPTLQPCRTAIALAASSRARQSETSAAHQRTFV